MSRSNELPDPPSIMTGEIAGTVASGGVDLVKGKITEDPNTFNEGLNDLKSSGNSIVNNFKDNVHLIVDNSQDLIEGCKERDKTKVIKGASSLAKVAAVSLVTVGAIKVADSKEATETVDSNVVSKVNSKADSKMDTK